MRVWTSQTIHDHLVIMPLLKPNTESLIPCFIHVWPMHLWHPADELKASPVGSAPSSFSGHTSLRVKMGQDGTTSHLSPICSMVLVYMLTWLGYIDGKIYVTIYSSTMDPSWEFQLSTNLANYGAPSCSIYIFFDDFPSYKPPAIVRGFPIAMFDYWRVDPFTITLTKS